MHFKFSPPLHSPPLPSSQPLTLSSLPEHLQFFIPSFLQFGYVLLKFGLHGSINELYSPYIACGQKLFRQVQFPTSINLLHTRQNTNSEILLESPISNPCDLLHTPLNTNLAVHIGNVLRVWINLCELISFSQACYVNCDPRDYTGDSSCKQVEPTLAATSRYDSHHSTMTWIFDPNIVSIHTFCCY